jgi:hypothetical protein
LILKGEVMPVCKRKPHLGEILNIATDQRLKLHETKIEIRKSPSVSFLLVTLNLVFFSLIMKKIRNSAKYIDTIFIENKNVFNLNIVSKRIILLYL